MTDKRKVLNLSRLSAQHKKESNFKFKGQNIKAFIAVLVLFFMPFFVYPSVITEKDPVFEIKSLDSGAVLLDQYWKYHEGDDSLWANPKMDDSNWIPVFYDAHPENPGNIHWYRINIKIDPVMVNIPLSMQTKQVGASEVYLDGVRLVSYGIISANKKDEKGFNPQNTPFIFKFSPGNIHVIAIRYSNHITTELSLQYAPVIEISKANDGIAKVYDDTFLSLIFIDITIGFFTGLTFLHLLLYFFYRADKNNLYYSLFTGTALLLLCYNHFKIYHTASYISDVFYYWCPIVYTLFFYIVFLLARNLFALKRSRYFYITTALTILTIALYLFRSWLFNFFFISVIFNVCITTIFTIRYAYRNKVDGAIILGAGLLFGVLFILVMLILAMLNGFNLEISGRSQIVFFSFLMLAVLSVPVSMSVYLARNFAAKSNTLIEKLTEVQLLSEKSAMQAKEKEDILNSQNIKLEQLVTLRTAEVTAQKNELESKNKEVTDSLYYASYLQEVILPPLSFIHSKSQDSLILFKPKDIVAGDFYYAEETGDYFFIAAADCTGHGVPGAMLSVLCSNALNQATREFGLTNPGLILDKVNDLVSATFEKSSQNVNDGMDISLLAFNLKEKQISWAGANNPLWAIFDNQIVELKGDKQPIGKYHNRFPFTSHNIPWQDGTWFYLVTDGFADQFGGSEGKKFMRKNLVELINSIHDKTGEEQNKILNETFLSWSGKNEQVDDVTIVGIKI